MATENNGAAQGAGGVSQGAAPADLDQGQGTGGAPKAPQAPAATREGFDEQHGGEGAPQKKTPAVEPPKGEEAPQEEPATEEPEQGSAEWHKQFVQTGNEHADAAIELMKESGVSPIEANAVFQKAIESGKLEDIDWSMLEGKLGKAKTGLVKAGVEAYFHGEYKGRLDTVNKAYEIVAGQQNWEKIRAWAQKVEKTDPAFKAKVDNMRSAINLGGWAAEQAVRELKGMYEAAPNNKGLGVGKVVQGDRAAPQADGSPLSRAEYMTERHKLAAAGVGPNDPRLKALVNRRNAGRAAGM